MKENLKSINKQMGCLYFTSTSPEVEEYYKEWFKETKSEFIQKNGWLAWWNIPREQWDEAVRDAREQIARTLTESKRKSWYQALTVLIKI